MINRKDPFNSCFTFLYKNSSRPAAFGLHGLFTLTIIYCLTMAFVTNFSSVLINLALNNVSTKLFRTQSHQSNDFKDRARAVFTPLMTLGFTNKNLPCFLLVYHVVSHTSLGRSERQVASASVWRSCLMSHVISSFGWIEWKNGQIMWQKRQLLFARSICCRAPVIVSHLYQPMSFIPDPIMHWYSWQCISEMYLCSFKTSRCYAGWLGSKLPMLTCNTDVLSRPWAACQTH